MIRQNFSETGFGFLRWEDGKERGEGVR